MPGTSRCDGLFFCGERIAKEEAEGEPRAFDKQNCIGNCRYPVTHTAVRVWSERSDQSRLSILSVTSSSGVLSDMARLPFASMLLVFMLFEAVNCLGRPNIVIVGREKTQNARVLRLAESLNVNMPWAIEILPETAWHFLKLHSGKVNASTAMSNYDTHVTYLRATYLWNTQDSQVRHTLAHEAGHLMCHCTEEWTTEKIAGQIERELPHGVYEVQDFGH